MHSWDAQAREGHSINGCRQTVRICKVKWNLRCTLVSGQHSLSAVRGRENIPAHTAVTCLHCYVLLYIESFSQLAPKNKHSLVCRWTRQNGLHGRRSPNFKTRRPFKNSALTTWPSHVQRTLFAFSVSHCLLCWLGAVTVYMLLCCWLGPASCAPAPTHPTFKQWLVCKYTHRVVFRTFFALYMQFKFDPFLFSSIKQMFSPCLHLNPTEKCAGEQWQMANYTTASFFISPSKHLRKGLVGPMQNTLVDERTTLLFVTFIQLEASDWFEGLH